MSALRHGELEPGAVPTAGAGATKLPNVTTLTAARVVAETVMQGYFAEAMNSCGWLLWDTVVFFACPPLLYREVALIALEWCWIIELGPRW